jgi:aldehyde dehydrogenase (NAD+)
MNVMTEVHPYLNGKPKRMLIGGKWLEAATGKTFETRNPATGEVLAHVAEGDAEDIDRAVAAARAAFNGPWSKFKPADRQRLLLKLADLVERDLEEFAALDTLDMGRRSPARVAAVSARWACCVSTPAWPPHCMARRSTTRCPANTCRSR